MRMTICDDRGNRIEDEKPIVSLGLANFYAQLTNREARAFITKKLSLLET